MEGQGQGTDTGPSADEVNNNTCSGTTPARAQHLLGWASGCRAWGLGRPPSPAARGARPLSVQHRRDRPGPFPLGQPPVGA